MAEVWRGISFEAYRFVHLSGDFPAFFTSEHYQCFFRAEGDLLSRGGHNAALDCLQSTVVAWMTENWAGGVLLPAADDHLQARALTELPRVKRALVPTSCDLNSLAAFLLEIVCEERLRDRGLLVTDVRLERAGEPEPGLARVSDAVRETYLAEQPAPTIGPGAV